MTSIPRDPAWDSTLAFLREGNTFVTTRCQQFQSDIFATRVSAPVLQGFSTPQAGVDAARLDIRFSQSGPAEHPVRVR